MSEASRATRGARDGAGIPLAPSMLALVLAGAALAVLGIASHSPMLSLAAGGIAGLALAGLGVVVALPRLMILREQSPLGFDDTVARLERAIVEHGWSHQGTDDLREKLHRKGVPFAHAVKNVRLCHPSHARSVLTTDRHLACLMPCSISVWEAEDGKVTISKMNTGLMGKLFGGNVARVMGGSVARDEASMLASLRAGAVAPSETTEPAPQPGPGSCTSSSRQGAAV